MPSFLFSLLCVALTFLACLVFSFLAFKIIEKTYLSNASKQKPKKREVFFVTNVQKQQRKPKAQASQTFKGTLLTEDEYLSSEYEKIEEPVFSSKRTIR